jgi:vacuolar-type H+-ATPase subunit E/Vma4
MTDPIVEGLAPVRRALLSAARRDAEQIRTQARTDADRVRADAAARAGAVRDEARARGAAAAERMIAAERASARRAARATVLRAQRESYDDLRAASRAAVARLVHDPTYPSLRAGMVRAVRRALGPDVAVTDHPDGGVIGVGDHRRIDYALDDLADRALGVVIVETREGP